jgi:nitrogenase molybdenum-iron protein NifN
MATVVPSRKACAESPLKSSTPLGAALAFLGVDGAIPLFHGSQGCTAFGLVLAVRHFNEAIPLQTTAMNEPSTILGGCDNLEEALINLQTRMKPRLIGVASTALVETRGEDFAGELKSILAKRAELAGTAVVFASTPDFEGALEDGWARATTAMIEALVDPPGALATPPRLNVLPGVHETAADIDELRATVAAFGLEATFLPDISGSLDGHVPDAYVGTTSGGAELPQIAEMGSAIHTLAVGEHMRAPAEALERRAGVPFTVLPTLTGLEPADRLTALLSSLSGRTAPASVRRRRSQLVDALLDGHFHLSGKRVAIAGDPDLLCGLASFFVGLGAEVVAAVASTGNSPLLATAPCEKVVVGDLADLEDAARRAKAELLVTHSHGRQAAERLGVPLFRVGFPIFDRLGVSHRVSVGYAGTRALVLDIANVFLGELHEPRLEDFQTRAPAPNLVLHSEEVAGAG